jgi:MoxR-like ATPase
MDTMVMSPDQAARGTEEPSLARLGGEAELKDLASAAVAIRVDRDLAGYAVELAMATRTSHHVLVGASPRASLALLIASIPVPKAEA